MTAAEGSPDRKQLAETVRELALLLIAADSVAAGDCTGAEHGLAHAIRIEDSLETEPWAEGRHSGDCTKTAHTCNRCVIEKYEETARRILASDEFLPRLAVLAEPCQCGETFRLIAQACGCDGTEPDDWRAMAYPTPGEFALQAVRSLRRDYDGQGWREAEAEVERLREEAANDNDRLHRLVDEREAAEAEVAALKVDVANADDYWNGLVEELREKLAEAERERDEARRAKTDAVLQAVKMGRRALAAERQLEQARTAMAERLRANHNDTCQAVLETDEQYSCSCGHDTLVRALAAAEHPEQTA